MQMRRILLAASHPIAECHLFHLLLRECKNIPFGKSKKSAIHLRRVTADLHAITGYIAALGGTEAIIFSEVLEKTPRSFVSTS